MGDVSSKRFGAGIRGEWVLNDAVAFLNHGSFGATPRVVLEEQERWRRVVEADPVEILARRCGELIEAAKLPVGEWLGMRPEDFGFVANATEGVNAVLASLKLHQGDELLTTTHVYNAVRQAMRHVAKRWGATYREVDVPVPVASPQEIEATVLGAVNERTKLLVVDHVTSPTAMIFPVGRIVERCRARRVDVLVDGAHAPGMVPLNVERLDATYYAGNLHKWACAPKGAGFLWVAPDRQEGVHPPTVSHYWGEGFAREFSWQGTRDISPWLAVPKAIEFMAALGWEQVRSYNHALAVKVRRMLCERWGVAAICPEEMIGSMVTVPLPPPLDQLDEAGKDAVQRRLYSEFRVEAPVMLWAGRAYVRPCCQVYNTFDQYERLADAILKMRETGPSPGRPPSAR